MCGYFMRMNHTVNANFLELISNEPSDSKHSGFLSLRVNLHHRKQKTYYKSRDATDRRQTALIPNCRVKKTISQKTKCAILLASSRTSHKCQVEWIEFRTWELNVNQMVNCNPLIGIKIFAAKIKSNWLNARHWIMQMT